MRIWGFYKLIRTITIITVSVRAAAIAVTRTPETTRNQHINIVHCLLGQHRLFTIKGNALDYKHMNDYLDKNA